MGVLTEDQKQFLVTRFATYLSLHEVVAAYNEEFGEPIDKRQAYKYNLDGWWARRRDRKDPMKKWRALFEKTRADFLKNTGEIAIANASHRLKMLDDMASKAYAKGNYAMAASLLEQAAKECGGLFTNKREVAGNIDHSHEHVVSTPEEKRNMLADRIAEGIVRAQQAKVAAGQPTKH